MVSMKRTPSRLKDKDTVVSREPEDYYPLTLYLDKQEIEKLGLTGANVKDEFMLSCKVCVTSLSMHQSEGSGEAHSSMTLTVREAEVEGDKPDSKADKIFGKSSK